MGTVGAEMEVREKGKALQVNSVVKVRGLRRFRADLVRSITDFKRRLRICIGLRVIGGLAIG
jgi:hypothetical protein